MPYTPIKKTKVKGKIKYCFWNKETGQRRCSDTKENAIAALRLLQGIEHGWKPTGKKSKK